MRSIAINYKVFGSFSRSSSRHSILVAGQIDHRSLEANSGSSPLKIIQLSTNPMHMLKISVLLLDKQDWLPSEEPPFGGALMNPLSKSSMQLILTVLIISNGANRYDARATGAAPGTKSI
ncbi:hypothetical protein Tco_1262902 [Tanacetum coccineum]